MIPAIGFLATVTLLLPGIDLAWKVLHRGAVRDQNSVSEHRRYLRQLGQVSQIEVG